MKTSIVIRTYNHSQLLKRLLNKISHQKRFKYFEIVVIDSSSKDGTVEIAKNYGCRVVNVNPKDFSHAYTFNLGAEKSKGDIIFYVSVDIIPKDEFWAYNIIKHFKYKKVAGVFGKQEPIKNFNPVEEFKTKKMFPAREKSCAFFSNASGAIKKSVWEKNKYDEKIPYQYIGGEDQKWAKAVEKKGWKIIYEPKSIVYHSHKYSLKARLKVAYISGLYQKEIQKWNQGVYVGKYNKRELINYLIKNKKFKVLFIDLLFFGVLLRFYTLRGKLKRKLRNL
ncbi:glycosyltransferase family 2 protein [Candidatus Pacearchaeota archaeon]|nr:glycosyltransferase family 2 protein [Candidatus Pacearchaeota archaeon]